VFHGSFAEGKLDREKAFVIYSAEDPPVYFNPENAHHVAAEAAAVALAAAKEIQLAVVRCFVVVRKAHEEEKAAMQGIMRGVKAHERERNSAAHKKEQAKASVIRNNIAQAYIVAATIIARTAAIAAEAAWVRAADPYANALANSRKSGKRGSVPAINQQAGVLPRGRSDSIGLLKAHKKKKKAEIDVRPSAPAGIEVTEIIQKTEEEGGGMTITWIRTSGDRAQSKFKKDVHTNKTIVLKYEIEWTIGKVTEGIVRELREVVDMADEEAAIKKDLEKLSLIAQLKGESGFNQTCTCHLPHLMSHALYKFRVRGWSAEHGWGHWSERITKRTLDIKLDPPDFLCVDDHDSSSCEMTWDASEGHVDAYELMWREIKRPESAGNGKLPHIGSITVEVKERPRSATLANGSTRRGSFIGMKEVNATIRNLHPGANYEVRYAVYICAQTRCERLRRQCFL
jgi:hypothetical protein